MKQTIAAKLLEWYDRQQRDLPWRISPAQIGRGVKPDPYRVWLSEIMLQQTTVEAVKKYFLAFTKVWPTVGELAVANEEDVLKAWAGLGYYSRARNLKKGCGCSFTRSWRGVSANAGGIGETARRRPLHFSGNCFHRIWRTCCGCGRQCRAGDHKA